MLRMTTIFVVLVACFGLAFAQDGGSAAAARAARVDALRQLGEMIQGVRISANTTVRDFVTQSDEIRGEYQGMVQGATQVGDVRYNSDGTCEVTLEISMDHLIYWMRTMTYKYTHDDPRQYDNIPNYNNYQKSFRATGSGAIATPDQGNNWQNQGNNWQNQGNNWQNQGNNWQNQGNNWQPPQPPQPPQGNVWDRVTAQGKAMAKRGAIVDAYRNLGEVIQGVRIDSRTTVRDFVTESDQINASFSGFVQGAQIVGDPRYQPDGVIEVTAQVDMNQLINTLQAISRQHNSRIHPQRFQGMQQYWPNPIVQATGSSAVNPKFIRPGSIVPLKPITPPQPPQPVRPYVPEWANRTVKVTGTGAVPPHISHQGQARLMAERAATMDAYRLLSEQVYGLRLEGQTTVKDFVTESDTINSEVHGHIQGAQIVDKRSNYDGTSEVDVELWLGHIWRAIEASYRSQYKK